MNYWKDTSILSKLALFLFIASLIMVFIVEPFSAEFYILIFSMILMLIIIVYSVIKVRKEIKKGE